MHQIAMHVLLEHLCVDQILAAKLANFLLAHELVLVIHNLTVLLLKFLCNVVHIWHPLGARTKLRNEVTSDFGVLQGSKHKAT